MEYPLKLRDLIKKINILIIIMYRVIYILINILYWIFAILALLCALTNLFLIEYLNNDMIINNHKYDKWYNSKIFMICPLEFELIFSK